MIIQKLSNNFYNYGCLIKSKKKAKSIKNLNTNKIIKEYEKTGVVLFRGFNFNKNNLFKFIKKFTFQFSNDAQRRKARFNNTNIRTVDSGTHKINLHSESSFNAACPEIIWFYCKRKPEENSGGGTILCDGIKIWDELCFKSKRFFLGNPINYKLSIKIPFKFKIKNKRQWYLNNIGSKNPSLNPQNSTVDYTQVRFAINETHLPGKLAFCNHLLIDLKYEPQIKKRKINNKELPKTIISELNKIIKKYTYKINWNNADLIMIDNKRIMHGRESFKKKSLREILNIQTKYANFGYGSTTRNIN